LAAGATHYLASPFGEQELAQALRFVDRYTVRLGKRFQNGALSEPETPDYGWQLDRLSGTVILTPALAGQLDLGEDALSKRWSDFVALLGDKAQAEAERALERLAATGETTAFAHDFPGRPNERMIHHLSSAGADGEVTAWVEFPDEDADTRPVRNRDFLTGLGDVRRAYQWIEEQLRAEDAPEPKLALLLISLHRFDMINAAYGSAAGDAALQGMARRIERLVFATRERKKMAARLAGAEFAVGLAPGVSLDEAEFFAQQLAAVIEQPFVSNGEVIQLKMRCGIVTGGEGDTDAPAVMRRASAALAEARELDGQAIRVFGDEEEGEATRASRLEIDLRLALNRDEIEIVFQPQVSVTTGAIAGVEALARWRHPLYGELGAAALFAAAERSDYLTELSAHVQHKALAIAAAWPEALSHLRLSVNVTAADMAAPDFVERFMAMIDETGFDKARLTLEVTESGLIADLGAAAERLAELRARGFRVAIDDFGTGYSSLAYLKSLPLDYLKIDRHLSQDIAGSKRDRVVISSVIEMANSLGLSVIAEGVETREQLTFLAEQGCELYQGFLCSPPVGSETLIELAERQGA
jgi:diguanylate cyclase (GGDEF)-like protein